MAFQNLAWLYIAVPVLVLLLVLRFWQRHYWGYSLLEQFGDEMGAAPPVWRVPKVLETAALGFLLVALLDPVYPFILNRVERGGLQILFVLDLSQSMEELIQQSALPGSLASAPSIAPPGPSQRVAALGPMLATPGSRMEAIKKSALGFVSKRPGDAIGLVVFSDNGYLVTPATFDHESVSQYLLMTGTQSLVNEGYTGIGEGLAAANRFFELQREAAGRRVRGQVILLFTDGENNTGREPGIEIERARVNGTRIYMIGIDLDESGTTGDLAVAIPGTGGRYYDIQRAGDLEQALTDINDVEKGIFYTLSVTRNQPAYFLFVVLSLACLALRSGLNAVARFVEIS